MPRNPWLKDKFLKYFMAKEFHLTPSQVNNMACSELDALFQISQGFNQKRNQQLEEKQMKRKAKMR